MEEINFKSTEIATALSKRHSHVLRDIRSLLDSSPLYYSREDCEFIVKQFEPSTYTNKRGKEIPYFEITQEGLTLLLPQYQCKEAKGMFVSFLRSVSLLTAESES